MSKYFSSIFETNVYIKINLFRNKYCYRFSDQECSDLHFADFVFYANTMSFGFSRFPVKSNRATLFIFNDSL